MNYVNYDYYLKLYGEEAIKEAEFNRFVWEASKKVDTYTTGIDGVKKLSLAFPEDENGAESIRRCICKIVDLMARIGKIEAQERALDEYITREDGIMHGKVVTSVTAGNESVSYGTGNINKAFSDPAEREKMYKTIITDCLSGVADNNGVYLLYMGVYPR